MALVSGPAVTKRLSFSGAPIAGLSRVSDKENTSPESLARALEVLRSTVTEHFKEIETTAIAKTEEVGEADLRRLKRQFGSLKNSFLHFEVKESFITSLLEGLPNGTEAEQLQMFEEEVEATVEQLRTIKAANKAAMTEIEALIEEACDGQGQILSQLNEISALLSSIPSVEDAVPELTAEDEAKEDARLAADTAAAAEEARRLESQLAEASSRIEDIEAASTALRSQLAELALRTDECTDVQLKQQRAQRERSKSEAEQRLENWAKTAIELCEALTGISILRYHDQGLDLAIRSFFPTAVVPSASELRNLPFAKTEHELHVVLEPGSTLVQAVTLVPPDVPLESAHFQGLPLPEMVHHVAAAIAGHKHRAFLLSSCLAASSSDPALLEATLNLGESRSVGLSLKRTWPSSAHDCIVVSGDESVALEEGLSLAQIVSKLETSTTM